MSFVLQTIVCSNEKLKQVLGFNSLLFSGQALKQRLVQFIVWFAGKKIHFPPIWLSNDT